MNTLAEALRITATGIEDGTLPYQWNHTERCNCGLLAANVMGITVAELSEQINTTLCGHVDDSNQAGSWTRLVGFNCPLTGLPENKIIRSLMEIGMKREDFRHMEFCDRPDVLNKMPKHLTRKTLPQSLWDKIMRRPPVENLIRNYDSKKFVSAYMRAWADILEEQQDAKLEAIELRELQPLTRSLPTPSPSIVDKPGEG